MATDYLPRDELIETIKRLHIPGYELARLHADAAAADGAVELNEGP